jgi:hypothetical protein
MQLKLSTFTVLSALLVSKAAAAPAVSDLTDIMVI